MTELRITCSLLDTSSATKINIRCSKHNMDCKTFQNPTFQVLYSGIFRDDHPPPLQIRHFTSDSYEAIKKRERKKSGRRQQNIIEQRSSVWNKGDTRIRLCNRLAGDHVDGSWPARCYIDNALERLGDRAAGHSR
jgi:hypothetical protein